MSSRKTRLRRRGAERRTSSPIDLIARASSGHRGALFAVSIAALLGALAEAGVLVLIARLAFALASGDDDVEFSIGPLGDLTVAIPVLIGIAAGLALLRVVFQVMQARWVCATIAAVMRETRSKLMRAYLRASWSLQSSEREGRLQELLTTYASHIAVSIQAVSNALVAFLSLVAFLVTAFFVNVIAAIVVMFAAAFVGMLLRPLRGAVRRRSAVSASAQMAFATEVTEVASHLQEVRVFNVQDPVARRMETAIGLAARADKSARFVQMLAPALYQGLALLLVVGAVGAVYATGVTRLASLGGIVLIMVRSLAYGQQLQTAYHALHNSAPYFETFGEELDRYAAAGVPHMGAPIGRIGSLEVRGVSYGYTPERLVLRDIEFDVHPGEIVGIVGPSGSGKSTLVQLLLRLRTPVAGAIYADGRDVRILSLDDWYERVSFVPQDPRLFAGTVADNIRFFRDDIDDAAVERAARQAAFHDEITAMPLGYDSPVGERGGQLSGGQRQRLSIARALVDEPSVLILDEPTSSLDVRSEALIRDTLRELVRDTTVFVIAHRLSTLDICDRIMVLIDGRLQAFDSPARLAVSNDFYSEALRLSGIR